MDVSQFLGGSWLNQSHLLQPYQVARISRVEQRAVERRGQSGSAVCVEFDQWPGRVLELNKTNLRRVCELFSTQTDGWLGQPLLIYRSITDYPKPRTLCVRVCGARQAPAEAVLDAYGNAVLFQPIAAPAVAVSQPQPVAAAPAPPAPVAAPQPQPVAAQYPQQPAADPWRGQPQPVAPPQPQQQNSPPAQS